MSAFIPMVSTTPPPIDDDDDDFGDFMDSGINENDEFADFSSTKDFDDFSYPSANPSSENVHSWGLGTDNEGLSNDAMPALDEEMQDENNDQEVKKVMANHHCESFDDVSAKLSISEGKNTIQISCNGKAMEDDRLAVDERNSEYGHNNEQSYSFTDSALTNYEDTTESVGNIDQRKDGLFANEQRVNIPVSEQSLELENQYSSKINVATEYAGDISPEVEGPPDIDQQEESDCGDEFITGVRSPVPASEEYLSDHCNDDDHMNMNDSEKTFILGESTPSETAISSDSFNAEKAENISNNCDSSSVPQPAMTSDSSDCQTQAEKKPSSESGETKTDDVYEDFTVDSCDNVERQDPQSSSQTSIDISDVISDSVCESRSNGDIPVDSNQTISFPANFDNFDDEDDFADFGSFGEQPLKAPEKESLPQSNNIEFSDFENQAASTDQDDGFADFPNVGTGEVTQDNGDFGDFSTTNIDNGDDDDFGDFDSNSANWAGFSDTVTKKLTFHEKVNLFVSRHVVSVDENVNTQIPHLDEHLVSDTLSKDVESPSMASVESAGIVWPGDLWDQLEDIDNTVALNFVWNGSHHNKYLLDSLGMQTQNILFSGTKQAYYVPTYYAAALGMVDPSKGIMKPMSAAEKITAMSPTEKNFPVVGEVSAEEAHPEWKTIADEQTSGQRMTVASSWLHSDRLMCNQDDNQISSKSVPILSSAMDLDYFDNLPTAAENRKLSGGADLIDPELLEVTSAPTTEPPPPPKDSGSATLSKILASIKGDSISATTLTTPYLLRQDNSEWADEENKLSAEARSVLQKLPDLSYMRSKVLIFPMNMSRMTIGEE